MTYTLTPAQARLLLSWTGGGGSTTDQRVGEALEARRLVSSEVHRHWTGGRMGGRQHRVVEYVNTALGEAVSQALWQQAGKLPDWRDDRAWRGHPGVRVSITFEGPAEKDEEPPARRNPDDTDVARVLRLDGARYFSDEALQHALDESGERSRVTIVAMSPDDFLRLAERGRDADKAATVEAALARGTLRDVPFLTFRNLGEDAVVTGHEGRHRAMALERLGVQRIPVRLVSQEYRAIPIRWSQWQDGPPRGEVWPTRLWPEGTDEATITLDVFETGRGLRPPWVPFPNSLLYPRK